jgi:microsomal dipeptidase-like Zn-dependent dipeptidase
VIVDLHNDLLSFLVDKQGRSVDDPLSRGSYPQLKAGGVQLQILAIFTTTGPQSVEKGRAQVETYLHLLNRFAPYLPPLSPSAIQVLPAFENASSFASESEPLSDALKRLETYHKALGKIAYIGLTWNSENRFGGGNDSSVGLKEDGKRLLAALSGKQIAIDFSHTSDPLAYDILEWIDKEQLDLCVLASHSNFRALSNYKRNLPEEIAKELIRRKGVIGLNFFAPFVHDTDPTVLARHVEYALHLGGEEALCFGADFFCDTDSYSAIIKKKYGRETFFYKEYSNASMYPAVLKLLADKLQLKEGFLQKLAHENAAAFLKRGFATTSK